MRRTGTTMLALTALVALASAGCLEGGHVVVVPAGGEEWVVGSTEQIAWVTLGVSEVDIALSRDGGATWTALAASVDASAGSYFWVVTAPESDDCIVRVTDASDSSQSAVSAGRFSIRNPEIAVIVPAGGEAWTHLGPDRLIEWASFGIEGNVDIFYSVDDGATWAGVDTNLPDTGSYLWTIPNEDSAQCLVMVQETGGAGAVGESPGTFTIAPLPGAAFTDMTAGLTGVESCALAWGDYDGDGALDLFALGDATGSGDASSVLYKGDGAGGFTTVATGIVDLMYGAAAWADIDGDDDLDLAVAGTTDGTATNAVTEVYVNDGGSFVSLGSSLVGVMDCALGWGDFDNDGGPDLLVAGMSDAGPITEVYRNNTVSLDPTTTWLTGFSRCAVAWGDYDGDGFADVAIAGEDEYGTLRTMVYHNSGGHLGSPLYLIGVEDGALAWGDYDNDGDLDLAIAGYNDVAGRVCRIYRNDVDWFTDTGVALVRVDQCGLAWGDYDSDGDLDLAIAGVSGSGDVAQVWRNDGDTTFADSGAALTAVGAACIAWGDADGDGRLDLAVAGHEQSTGPTATVYRNITPATNTAPSAPTGLATEVDEAHGIVTFSWSAGTDDETPCASLSYNLRVVDTLGGTLVVPGMTRAALSERLVPAMGNAYHRTSYPLGWLQRGTYTWSVQTIDSGYVASAWSAEETLSYQPDVLVIPPVFTTPAHPDAAGAMGCTPSHDGKPAAGALAALAVLLLAARSVRRRRAA